MRLGCAGLCLGLIVGCPALTGGDPALIGGWFGFVNAGGITNDVYMRFDGRRYEFVEPVDGFSGTYVARPNVSPKQIDLRIDFVDGPPQGAVLLGRTALGIYDFDADGNFIISFSMRERPSDFETAGLIAVMAPSFDVPVFNVKQTGPSIVEEMLAEIGVANE